MPGEVLVCSTLIELADSLLDDFDAIDHLTLLATRCVDLLDVDTAEVMLVGPEGDLRYAASSRGSRQSLELFELQTKEGPCLDSFRLKKRVIVETPANLELLWPRFGRQAIRYGYKAAYAFPIRLREHQVGSLSMFRSKDGSMSLEDLFAAQAFADMASIAILRQRSTCEVRLLNNQLTKALISRAILEQAKGVLVGRRGMKVEEAFDWMRCHARHNNLKVAFVAQEIVDGKLD
jgi:GAF domain-containing protein